MDIGWEIQGKQTKACTMTTNKTNLVEPPSFDESNAEGDRLNCPHRPEATLFFPCQRLTFRQNLNHPYLRHQLPPQQEGLIPHEDVCWHPWQWRNFRLPCLERPHKQSFPMKVPEDDCLLPRPLKVQGCAVAEVQFAAYLPR